MQPNKASASQKNAYKTGSNIIRAGFFVFVPGMRRRTVALIFPHSLHSLLMGELNFKFITLSKTKRLGFREILRFAQYDIKKRLSELFENTGFQ